MRRCDVPLPLSARGADNSVGADGVTSGSTRCTGPNFRGHACTHTIGQKASHRPAPEVGCSRRRHTQDSLRLRVHFPYTRAHANARCTSTYADALLVPVHGAAQYAAAAAPGYDARAEAAVWCFGNPRCAGRVGGLSVEGLEHLDLSSNFIEQAPQG